MFTLKLSAVKGIKKVFQFCQDNCKFDSLIEFHGCEKDMKLYLIG